MRYNVEMALSKFTAIMVEKPDEYKAQDGSINYYPSDVLYDWRYHCIDINGQNASKPRDVAGIICEGVWHMGETPRKITIMFNDL